MHRLFVYGTLKDEKVRKAIFGREVSALSAVLENFGLYHDGSYYFISPCRGKIVTGYVLEVNDRELLLADKWEDVPLYTRKEVAVICAGQSCKAWTYTKDGEPGEEVKNPQFAVLSMEEVYKAVDVFCKNNHCAG